MKRLTLLSLVLLAGCSQVEQKMERPRWDPETRPDLHAAVQVGEWLRSTVVETPRGLAWPDDALAPGEITPGLGNGVAGTTLFFLALMEATGSDSYAADVRQGADYLLATLPARLEPAMLDTFPPASGLYGGVAGVGFALGEAHRRLGDPRYLDGARRVVTLLAESARPYGDGVAWNLRNGILEGASGTGLFLLYAGRTLQIPEATEMAAGVGRALLSRAIPDSLGRPTWKMSEDREAVLPNFSHGAAGVGYFLASLFSETEDRRFLGAAELTVDRLVAEADTTGGGLLVPYGRPNPEWAGKFDLGWAHGPVGTARLFYRMAHITGDPEYTMLVAACTRGLRRSGVAGAGATGQDQDPLRLDRRFGAAGIADYFVSLYDEEGEETDLADARALVDRILDQSRVETDRRWWEAPRYPFFSRPGEPAAFTGFFHGAVGYGLLLLHLDAATHAIEWDMAFPDDPWGPQEERSAAGIPTEGFFPEVVDTTRMTPDRFRAVTDSLSRAADSLRVLGDSLARALGTGPPVVDSLAVDSLGAGADSPGPGADSLGADR